jgi:hypothetical protein
MGGMYADFKQARNPAFHRKFFAESGFDYWQPSGGAISPADKKLVRGYVQLVAHYAGHADTLQELADQYLRDEAEKRAGNISAVKSFEAFRSWVTIEAVFIPNTRCLMAPPAKNPNPYRSQKWTI